MSDTDPNAPPPGPEDELQQRAASLTTYLRDKAAAALNYVAPKKVYDPVTNRWTYLSAPTDVFFASPLKMGKAKGTGARNEVLGPGGERRVTPNGGWGFSRPLDYDRNTPGTRRHQGIDFVAPEGEEVLAAADGYVSFAGIQSRVGGRVQLPRGCFQRPGSSTSKSRLDADIFEPGANPLTDQAIKSATRDVGFGGLYVEITHTQAPYEGYVTRYMHLGKILVDKATGTKIVQGQPIGLVGGTGGGVTGTIRGTEVHLHFQVHFRSLSTVVNCSAIVPNYNPIEGQTDSTRKGDQLPFQYTGGSPIAYGQSTIQAQAAGVTAARDREVSLAGQGRELLQSLMSEFFDRMAKGMTVETSSLYVAAAQFQGKAPVIDDALAFNFTTGTWGRVLVQPDGSTIFQSDGRPV